MCVEIDSDISIVFSTDIFNYTQQILKQFAHFEPSFDRKILGTSEKGQTLRSVACTILELAFLFWC